MPSEKRVRLIRRREGLQVVRKRRKRKLLGMTTQWVNQAHYPNHVWSYDFVFDRTEDARQLKCMTVVDEFTRQGFEITVGRSLTASDVIRILDKLFAKHGRPVCLRSDNGPERVSRAVQNWLKKMHVEDERSHLYFHCEFLRARHTQCGESDYLLLFGVS